MCRISYFILFVLICFLLNNISGAEDRLKWCTDHLLLSSTVKNECIKWTRKEFLKYISKFNHWRSVTSTILQNRTDKQKGIVRSKLLNTLCSKIHFFNEDAVHIFSFYFTKSLLSHHKLPQVLSALVWDLSLNCPYKMCMLEGKKRTFYSHLLFWSQGNRARSYSLYHNYIFLICHLAQHTWFLAQQQILFLCCFIIQVRSHRWQFLSPSIVQLWLESHSQVIFIIFQNAKCNHKLYGSNCSIGNNSHV